ncbi:hypothetical protein B0H14DRAFT_2579839 [Mycena olivaceomarginata]|nr:hypothetical protein B0H14DRAFT_2579839 [Mycena olivaceomarginata]
MYRVALVGAKRAQPLSQYACLVALALALKLNANCHASEVSRYPTLSGDLRPGLRSSGRPRRIQGGERRRMKTNMGQRRERRDERDRVVLNAEIGRGSRETEDGRRMWRERTNWVHVGSGRRHTTQKRTRTTEGGELRVCAELVPNFYSFASWPDKAAPHSDGGPKCGARRTDAPGLASSREATKPKPRLDKPSQAKSTASGGLGISATVPAVLTGCDDEEDADDGGRRVMTRK